MGSKLFVSYLAQSKSQGPCHYTWASQGLTLATAVTSPLVLLSLASRLEKHKSCFSLLLRACAFAIPSGGSDGEESACNAGDLGLIPGSERSSGEGNGNPLLYPCRENFLSRGVWWTAVHGITKSWTRLSDWHTHSLSTLRCLFKRHLGEIPSRCILYKIPVSSSEKAAPVFLILFYSFPFVMPYFYSWLFIVCLLISDTLLTGVLAFWKWGLCFAVISYS